MSSSPIVEMTGAISRRTGKKKKYSNPLSDSDSPTLDRGRRENLRGTQDEIKLGPFPIPSGRKASAYRARGKGGKFRRKGTRDYSLRLLALKDESLSSVRGQNRGGHDIPAGRSTLPAAAVAALAERRPPLLSRPPLSSHKAAMLQSLASSRKLDIRGPPPKSC